jgi:hypothetical protein
MLEQIIKFGRNPSLVGVLTEADESLRKNCCVIISNSGLIHKPGPNRLSVKIARQLASKGVHAFRFDFSGMGDSPLSGAVQDSLQANITEIKLAMDKVTAITGITSFALYGLCSAAEVSFRASLEDERVSRLILVDGYYQTDQLLEIIMPVAARKCNIRYYKKHLLDYRRWIKILSGRSKAVSWKNLRAIPAALTGPLIQKAKRFLHRRDHAPVAAPRPVVDSGIDKWETLFKRGLAVQLIYSEGSHYVDLYHHSLAAPLKPFRKRKALDYRLISNADHTFTPVWSQQRLADLVCRWVEDKSHT